MLRKAEETAEILRNEVKLHYMQLFHDVGQFAGTVRKRSIAYAQANEAGIFQHSSTRIDTPMFRYGLTDTCGKQRKRKCGLIFMRPFAHKSITTSARLSVSRTTIREGDARGMSVMSNFCRKCEHTPFLCSKSR